MTEDVTDRLNRLESLVEQQQATIEAQRDRIAELEGEDAGGDADRDADATANGHAPARPAPDASDDTAQRVSENGSSADAPDTAEDPDGTSVSDLFSRRSLLQGAAVLGLGGYATSTASAATPRGNIGTSEYPIGTLYLDALTGPITGGTTLTSLTGDGLTIAESALAIDAANLGDATGVYAGTGDSGTAEFRTLEGSGSVDVSADGDVVTIDGSDSNTNTQTDVSDSGTTKVTSTSDLNFASNLTVTDDGDGTATIDASGGSTSELVTSTSGDTAFQVVDGGENVSDAEKSIKSPNVVGGHPSNHTNDTSGDVPPKGVTIAGGGRDGIFENVVSANYATISGGHRHTAKKTSSTIGGGYNNEASGNYSTVSGGQFNMASEQESTVSGGNDNEASGQESTVSGGVRNTASGRWSTVSGGSDNLASGNGSTVPGGDVGAATNADSFVWNDGTAYHPAPVSDGLNSNKQVDGETVTGSNTFSVSAKNGFRFITGGASSPSVVTVDDDGSDARLQTHSYGLNIKTNDNGNLTLDPGSSNELSLSNQSTSSSGSLLAIDGSGNLVEADSKTLSDVGGGSTSELVTSIGGDTALQVFDGGNQVSGAGVSIDAPNVIGGHPNNDTGTASPKGATISGGGSDGAANVASANHATVGGGKNNTAGKSYATVSGGEGNTANDKHSTVGGGKENDALGELTTVSGGLKNDADGFYATIGGGNNNSATQQNATVAGGAQNTASSPQATVPGGQYGAATNRKSFVWNDSEEYHSIPNVNAYDGLNSDKQVASEPVTGANTFSVSAASGFRFITGGASSPNVTYIDGSGNLVSAGNVDLGGNNLNNVASIDNGSSAISVDDALNLSASDSIQDSSTDAISFDGSANVTVASGDLTVSPSSNSAATLDVQNSSGSSVLTVDTESTEQVVVRETTNGDTLTLKHDDTDGVISTSTGDLKLSPNSGTVDLDANTVANVGSINSDSAPLNVGDNVDLGSNSLSGVGGLTVSSGGASISGGATVTGGSVDAQNGTVENSTGELDLLSGSSSKISLSPANGTVDVGGNLDVSTQNITTDTTTGTQIATGTSQKLGFFGTSPVVKQGGPGSLTDNTSGTAGDTIASVSGSGADSTINNNFASLAEDLEAIRSALASYGLL